MQNVTKAVNKSSVAIGFEAFEEVKEKYGWIRTINLVTFVLKKCALFSCFILL